MIPRAGRQGGQPLLALGLVLAGWTLFRLVTLADLTVCRRMPCADAARPAGNGLSRPKVGPGQRGSRMAPERSVRLTGTARAPVARGRGAGPGGVSRGPAMSDASAGQAAMLAPMIIPQSRPAPRETSAAEIVAPLGTGRRSHALPGLSGDAWVLVRGTGSEASGLAASYGASQAGVVLRLPVPTVRPLRAFAYLRGAGALGTAERDLGLGLAARPLARLPMIVAGEVRVVEGGGGRRARPALGLITAPAPRPITGGLIASVYGQAGWVGGRGATAYAEGQMVVDHAADLAGKAVLRAGIGTWGAAQRGASRLDAGPSVSVILPISPGGILRLQADWRQRLAGNARPGSGPALIVATSF